MLKTKVLRIEEYNNYVLECNNKIYNLTIEFLGDKVPKVNDVIYVNDKILEEVNLYTYGPLNSKYSKNINVNEEELIKVVTSDDAYYLQRYYG